jgi:hypothetical protein
MTTFKSMLKSPKKNSYIKQKLGPFYILHTENNLDNDTDENACVKKTCKIRWEFDLAEDEDDDSLSLDVLSYQSSDKKKVDVIDI